MDLRPFDKSLIINFAQIRKALRLFRTQVIKDQVLVPFNLVVVQRQEIMLLQQKNDQIFFVKLGKILEQVAIRQSANALGVGDFVQMLMSSPQEDLHQKDYYLIQKIGKALIRTNILIINPLRIRTDPRRAKVDHSTISLAHQQLIKQHKAKQQKLKLGGQ